MCGIIGFIGMGDIANKIVLEGLKRLEYRGYDSVGIAMICSDNRLVVKKDAGKIDEVHLKLNFLEPKSNLIIGHVRWATHGAPTMENAHPHVDCSGGIAVVHNGVIENFLELKRELEDKGHRFMSRTDTAVSYTHLTLPTILRV